MNFGQALGSLIQQKRKVLGLTQMQLSEDAYGSTAKTRRISELENGQVANPHPKTIDPIIVTLGITEEELSECAKSSHAQPDRALDEAYTQAYEMIRDLAAQFDNANPEASLEELEQFLKSKAREYLELRENISKIEASDDQIGEIQKQALQKLSEGDFEEVDQLLAQAEDIQQEQKTLEQIRKQFWIRALRGDNKFLEGQFEDALALYKSAAQFFEPFDKLEMIESLEGLARRIYESGRCSTEPSFMIAKALLKCALEVKSEDKTEEIDGGIYYRLSLVCKNEACLEEHIDTNDGLDEAIKHARQAIKKFSNLDKPYEYATSQISLGNCLFEKARLEKSEELASSAVEVFENVIAFLKEKNESQLLLGHACNSLGAAYTTHNNIANAWSEEEELKKAKRAYTDALNSCEESMDLEVWGCAHTNLGTLIAQEASMEQDEEAAFFLRLKSISHLLTAIETYPITMFPYPYAQAHMRLAEVFFAHGAKQPDYQTAELYWGRSMASCEAAYQIFTKEKDPLLWANLQCGMGKVLMAHGFIENVSTSESDFTGAMSFFEGASDVFRELGQEEELDACEAHLKTLSEALQSIKDEKAAA